MWGERGVGSSLLGHQQGHLLASSVLLNPAEPHQPDHEETHAVLNAAFLGSAGATAQWLDGKLWPGYAAYLKAMATHREHHNVANIVEQQYHAVLELSFHRHAM